MKSKSKAKQKRISSKSVIPATKSVVLTPEDHLLRQRALLYLVDKRLTIREISRKLNVPQIDIKSFFEDENFLEELNERLERVEGIDADYRLDHAKITLSNLYEEMHRREVEEELKDVPTRDLHRMITETQKELRLDTPGDFTSKVGVGDLGSLQDRYKKSLSGKMHKMKRISMEKKIIKNVTPDENFEKEANGNSKAGSGRLG